jgi:low temperature requirement protein LtrA
VSDPIARKGTDFVELFFDLVYVFAITQVASQVREHLHGDELLRGGIVFLLLWWAWSQFTWMGGGVDFSRGANRGIMLVATGVTFFMASAVGDAFAGGGRWFGVTYLLVMALALSTYAWNERSDRHRLNGVLIYGAGAMAGAGIVAVGGFLGPETRLGVWWAALVVSVLATFVAGSFEFQVTSSHFAERHGLIVIIVLGEALIAIGVGTLGTPRSPGSVLALSLALMAAVALWWAYFSTFRDTIEERLAAASGTALGELARDAYTLAHVPIVAGILLYAVAVEGVVAHPGEPLGAGQRWALVAGFAAFLTGSTIAAWRATRSLHAARPIAIAALLTVGAVGADAAGTALLGVGVALLAATLVAEEWHRSRFGGGASTDLRTGPPSARR